MSVANDGKGHSMSDLSSRYQAWVTGFAPPYEWRWNATWWDGFDEPRCTLLEAKANYAFMFVPALGVPKPWAPVKSASSTQPDGIRPKRDPLRRSGSSGTFSSELCTSTALRSIAGWDWRT